MVGVQGFEPWTPCSQSRCATRLRYTPTESIFYTERGIPGKSCKIPPMVAYFSSKFKSQIHAAFTAAVLVFCLLGTHWVGLSHGISHAGFQNQVSTVNASPITSKSFSHSSEVCHLFDALSLAGFVPNSYADAEATLISILGLQSSNNPSLRSFASSSYHSRAPPTFVL